METKKTHIVRGLRQIWLRSAERAAALKRDDYSCVKCGVKQSRAKDNIQKVQVHHKKGIGNWDKVVQAMREEILCDPSHLETLCPVCHKSSESSGTAKS